ncbi:hypothetical protein D3C87_621100 [compost metagenome]
MKYSFLKFFPDEHINFLMKNYNLNICNIQNENMAFINDLGKIIIFLFLLLSVFLITAKVSILWNPLSICI